MALFGVGYLLGAASGVAGVLAFLKHRAQLKAAAENVAGKV